MPPGDALSTPDRRRVRRIAAFLVLAGVAGPVAAMSGAPAEHAWWAWLVALFVVCFVLGVVAVPAGVGGGVLFVPIVGGFFPFHLDFVRAAGLLVALASAVAAGPRLLRTGLADLRLALPLALVASIGALAGALLGLVLPAPVMQVLLGTIIIGIVVLMAFAGRSEYPRVAEHHALRWPRVHGVLHDVARGVDVHWRAHRFPAGMAAFAVNGLVGGMFGVGAGWANVPTLNLLMGVPLKIAVGTSSVILTIASSSAIWTYLNAGAVLPIVAAPAVIGMMIGARVGVRLLFILHGAVIRRLVIVLLLFAGLRSLLRGLGWWE